MEISVVIPTCNRKKRLLSLLQNLDSSTFRLAEVIIVDSGEEQLAPAENQMFKNLRIQYLRTEKSVCIQRNAGINKAQSDWILLCDDDIEIAADYVQKLVDHFHRYNNAGAISGTWMEQQHSVWKATHPVRSNGELLWKFIFQLGIWGPIECKTNFVTHRIKRYYLRKGNHLSKAGWPVNTNLEGDNIICNAYSLGAALVRKDWLLASPFDEVLDRYGIGDNYGVIAGFPQPTVFINPDAIVYHHLEQKNRLQRNLQHYRRVLALDYFILTKKPLKGIKRRWLAWSLVGNLIAFIRAGDGSLARTTFKALKKILFRSNPYYTGLKKGEKLIEPTL